MSDPSFFDFLQNLVQHPRETVRHIERGRQITNAQDRVRDEAARVRSTAESRERMKREADTFRDSMGVPDRQPEDSETRTRRARAEAGRNAQTYREHSNNRRQMEAAEGQAAMRRIEAHRQPDQGVAQNGELLDVQRARDEADRLEARGDYQDLRSFLDAAPDDQSFRRYLHHQDAVEHERNAIPEEPRGYRRELGRAIGAARDADALDYENSPRETQNNTISHLSQRAERYPELDSDLDGHSTFKPGYRAALERFLSTDPVHQETRQTHASVYSQDRRAHMTAPEIKADTGRLQDQRGVRDEEDLRRRSLRAIGEGRYSVTL